MLTATAPARVLVVEDDEDSRDAVVAVLEHAGYRVVAAPNAHQAVAVIRSGDIDLLLLDLRLPGPDGYDILAEIRETRSIPVIILSGLVSPQDKALGLRLGADDYVGKPFDAVELLARVEARLRPTRTLRVIRLGSLTIDVARRQVFMGSRGVELTNRQFDVLSLLASDPGRVFTRDEILNSVWGTSYVTSRNVNEQVRLLRERLSAIGAGLNLIESVPGRGYRVAASAVAPS